MTYKKKGGLHFVRIGRFGFSFFWSSKKARVPRTPRITRPTARESFLAARLENDIRREANLVAIEAIIRPTPNVDYFAR